MTPQGQAQKARGAFFTPPAISQFLSEWAIRSASDKVFEPSCGDAAFLIPSAKALVALGCNSVSQHLTGMDIHEPSVEVARSKLIELGHDLEIATGDFFDMPSAPSFDAVVGNPPYVRYQEFTGASRAKALAAALASGVRLTSLASSWAAFTIHAASLLKDDGRLALVLPAELLSVSYAAEVRRFLLGRFASVQLVLFELLVFPGILEDVVLLLAEGRGRSTHFQVYQVRNAEALPTLDLNIKHGFTPLANEKWTPALIPADALETYRELTMGSNFCQLSDWGSTYLGAVTGNNDFFTLAARDVAALKLAEREVRKISPPGARHLRGLTFGLRAWEELAKEGARCYLFAPTDRLSKGAKSYIERGERENVHLAYKCAVREPWWAVPLVDTPDILFTYMNHDRPRLITNDVGAEVLNSLYGIRLKNGLKVLGKSTLPVACLNTITLLGSEVVGRAYGGGLLKHEPREADAMPVPSVEILRRASEDLQLLKPQLSVAMRANNLQRAVEMVDAVILEKHLQLSGSQIGQLRSAREALFNRRRARGKSSRGSN